MYNKYPSYKLSKNSKLAWKSEHGKKLFKCEATIIIRNLLSSKKKGAKSIEKT